MSLVSFPSLLFLSISLRLSLSLHLGKLDSLPACPCKRRLPRLSPTYSFSRTLDVPPYHPPVQLSPHLSAELSDGGLTVAAHGSSIESLAGRAPYSAKGMIRLAPDRRQNRGQITCAGTDTINPRPFQQVSEALRPERSLAAERHQDCWGSLSPSWCF